MRVIILLFVICLGAGLALKDALRSLDYRQQMLYINQSGRNVPATQAAAPQKEIKIKALRPVCV
ncbi:hypothetical protein [Rufibacter immobilis]|uniref:hypothetical protein n=1 Tax=Rufibacter immobilis TaxID=1348778 RepID=UPI0035EDE02E